MRVIDKDGGFTDYLRPVRVHNLAPTAAGADGPDGGRIGATLTFALTGADPSPVDQAALRFQIDWDNNGTVDQVVVGPPGTTVTMGTGSTMVLHEDKTIALNANGNGADLLRNGSGRIVATSKSIACTALIADKLHAIVDPAVSSLPPPPFTNLPLIRVP